MATGDYTPSSYMDGVIADRSLLLDQDDATAGQILVSIETCEELTEDDGILLFIENNFGPFLSFLRKLPKKDQDLLLSYYLLRKPQHHLAAAFSLTQTVVSFQLRLAVRALAAVIQFGGDPTAEQMRPILEPAGLDAHTFELPNSDGVTTHRDLRLSDLLAEYIAYRSFARIASRYGLHRPDVRREFRRISKVMIESDNHEQRALGSYIELLVSKQSPTSVGYTACGKKALNDVARSDPAILGEFRVDVEDPDFDHLFQSRASI